MTIDELFSVCKKQGATIDGNVISAGGSLDLRSLTSLPEGVTLSAATVLSTTINQRWRGRQLLSVDGHVMDVGDAKAVGDAIVHRATYFGRRDSDAVYVAKIGEHWAHGKSIAEAITDARFKSLQSDPSDVVAEIKSTQKVTREQYRAITGACREGVRQWCESHQIGDDVESVGLGDVLDMLGDSYGADKFRELMG